jgi:hypothetical protein
VGLYHVFSGLEDGMQIVANNHFTVGTATMEQLVLHLAGMPAPRFAVFNNNLDMATGKAPMTGCLLNDGSTCLDLIADINACDWVGCYMAANNIEVDPEFVDASNDKYQLADDSLLIDAGANPAPWISPDVFDWIWFDRDNAPRPMGNTWDIGAYEYAM